MNKLDYIKRLLNLKIQDLRSELIGIKFDSLKQYEKCSQLPIYMIGIESALKFVENQGLLNAIPVSQQVTELKKWKSDVSKVIEHFNCARLSNCKRMRREYDDDCQQREVRYKKSVETKVKDLTKQFEDNMAIDNDFDDL